MLRTLALLAVVCVSVLPIDVPAQNPALPSVDEIVKKHIDARGGLDKLRALQSVRFTGKVLAQGVELELTMTAKRPGSVRMDSSFQGRSVIQAYDGTTGWMVNPFMGSSDPQALSGDQLEQMKENADLDGSLVDYKAKGVGVELLGKEDLGGKAVYKLKVTKSGGRTEIAYIDATTFLQVRATSTTGQQEIDQYLGDYKPVNGVLFPFAIESKVGGQTVAQIILSKGEANVQVDDAMFKMPAKAGEQTPKP
jgi:outer membrane lipoprotein-sorting protein